MSKELDILVQEEALARAKVAVGSKSKVLQDWWATIARLLEYHEQGIRNGDPLPLPLEVVHNLSLFAGYLAVGTIPGPIADVTGPGARRPGPTEIEHIGWATAYVQLCRAGILADRSPNKTIQVAYGVTAAAVQKWAKLPLPDVVRRALESAPDFVADKVASAGPAYRKDGRGMKAIGDRGAKRRQGLDANKKP